ncbi:Oidioi.mRNA.OKI2018_I69.PAR.g12810.t1.cds [Oikopleura dioica]|uniref:Oidioi.mRNA.OKI2018_I69.PAR.g12810.t1.cds n=1 Tax=Oikopleura dioica TaxID=34765 RepID=A0ABN7S5M3_OIKDI|nr:Oidioi.mRNA.OKI2018_I69.PAR.g12810.t1.cds [Oikopleura dioica]
MSSPRDSNLAPKTEPEIKEESVHLELLKSYKHLLPNQIYNYAKLVVKRVMTTDPKLSPKGIVTSAVYLAYKFSPEPKTTTAIGEMLKCPNWMIYKTAPLVRTRFNKETKNELEIARKYIDQQAHLADSDWITRARQIADHAWHPNIKASPKRIAASSAYLAYKFSPTPMSARKMASFRCLGCNLNCEEIRKPWNCPNCNSKFIDLIGKWKKEDVVDKTGYNNGEILFKIVANHERAISQIKHLMELSNCRTSAHGETNENAQTPGPTPSTEPPKDPTGRKTSGLLEEKNSFKKAPTSVNLEGRNQLKMRPQPRVKPKGTIPITIKDWLEKKHKVKYESLLDAVNILEKKEEYDNINSHFRLEPDGSLIEIKIIFRKVEGEELEERLMLTKKIKISAVEKYESDCGLCQEDLPEDISVMTCCYAYYHNACLRKWLANRPYCKYCNTPL